MYICMYVYMYVCMYVLCMYECSMYVCTYVCIYVWMYACMYICMYVCMYVVYKHAYAYIHVGPYLRTYWHMELWILTIRKQLTVRLATSPIVHLCNTTVIVTYTMNDSSMRNVRKVASETRLCGTQAVPCSAIFSRVKESRWLRCFGVWRRVTLCSSETSDADYMSQKGGVPNHTALKSQSKPTTKYSFPS